jgi:hypothetical protein
MKAVVPITFLAMPKPFHGHIGIIQRNAITSWTKLVPRPDIYLFGEEEGVEDLAVQLGIGHLHNIARSEFGTPMLDDLLRQAGELAKTPLLCYANSDIILLQEFLDAVQRIHRRFPKFLAVTHRLNINITEPLDFATDGETRLRGEIMPLGKPGNDTAIDVFVFPPEVYREVPPLAIGRAWFDQWLIKDALRQGIPVVDVTLVARAIHQNHDYAHIDGGQRGAYWGEEARRSLTIYGGVPHAFTLLDVTHELLPDGSFRRVRFRRRHAKLREWIWRRLIVPTSSFRHRLGLRRAVPQKTDKNKI